MKAIVTFNNLDLEVLEYKDTWSLSDRQVAEGFGVTQEAVRKQRTQGATEYIEGVHYYYKDMYNDGKGGVYDTPPDKSGGVSNSQKMVFWTKKGVITLGFKLTETPQTIAFRDWASDFILNSNNRPTTIQELLDNPRSLAELALRYADTLEENNRLEAQAIENKPYIAYAKTIESSKGSIKIGDYAKTLCNKEQGINTGQNQLFALMRELGILMFNNEPLQKYLNMGYFEYKPQPFTKPNGERCLSFRPLITPRGQVKLAKKLIEAIKAKNTPRIKS
ncbi:phage antirepressor KilAC domain-containing protein [Campylobacter concisus]|uniref:phage antirepressor KilAC domain-containing protein n=1 Tax=Campylobacter concisus TaxID=199 RepID=UPI000CD92B08|nr:phage antirepressor KilAC domain-containing protein [Campylobacter concisus]MBE9819146.1 phage antirepressor protein [Campylobacter concisus]